MRNSSHSADRNYCNATEYFPSPASSIGSNYIASMLKLNVTIYFTPALPFIPPALTRQPQKVLDVVKIMVVMAPHKSVMHLKQQISKTISIIAKDEHLAFGNNFTFSSIRNSLNFVAHNEMILGHVFHHDENIYAIVISKVDGSKQYIASPLSINQHDYQGRVDRINDYKFQSNHLKSHHHVADRNERVRHVQSRDNITTSEESEESDGTYESSFVEKEDREGFLDLEAEETDGSESGDKSPSPKFNHSVHSTSNRKVSLNELKKRRKSLIQVSESEDDEFPEQFKSHSHYVTNLLEEKMQLKENENLDDKEVDTETVFKEMKIDSVNVYTHNQPINTTPESDSESSSSEEDSVRDNSSKGNEIVRDSGDDSETTSEDGSDSTEDEKETTKTEIKSKGENEDSKNKDIERPVESAKIINQPKSNSEPAKDSTDLKSPTVDSKTEKESKSKESTPSKPSKTPKKSSTKRKYSSLSEIASNASNHSSSSKSQKSKNQSRFCSSSSDSESSESQYSNEKKVKRSSLKSLSKDVSTSVKNPNKPKSVQLKPKTKPQPKNNVKNDLPKFSEKPKSGKPINALLNGSNEFKSSRQNDSSSSSE